LALLFRELALPYCLVAGAMAAWKRRWVEGAAWAVGIALFFALLAWHVGQVKTQLADLQVETERGGESLAVESNAISSASAPSKIPDPVGAAAGGMGQWVRF